MSTKIVWVQGEPVYIETNSIKWVDSEVRYYYYEEEAPASGMWVIFIEG